MSYVSLKHVINLGKVGDYFLLKDLSVIDKPYILAVEYDKEFKLFYYIARFSSQFNAQNYALSLQKGWFEYLGR